jgi:type IV fimbrial biogenesis protein FimT
MRHLTAPPAAAVRPPVPTSRRAARGVTLVELMVALAIAALLAMAAAPSFSEYLANSRLRENGNTLFAMTLFAQSEAIKRNTVVRLAVADGAIEVSDQDDPDNPVVLRTVAFSHGISADDAEIDFGGEGRPVGLAAAEVDLAHPSESCSAEIRCPGLRVDGGGGVRLCGDHTGTCE